jgi:hypothetical protein
MIHEQIAIIVVKEMRPHLILRKGLIERLSVAFGAAQAQLNDWIASEIRR